MSNQAHNVRRHLSSFDSLVCQKTDVSFTTYMILLVRCPCVCKRSSTSCSAVSLCFSGITFDCIHEECASPVKKKKGMCMNAADFFLPLSMSKYDRRHPYIYLHRYPLELTWHDCVAGWELGGRRVGLTVCKQQALIPSSLGLAGP